MFKSAEEAEQPQGVSIPSEFRARADRKMQIAIAVVLFILFCVAYKGVVSKSFLGDDHVHLIWLRQAVLDPSLVLRNFYSNWLYPSTTPQCYRPMISVFMFTDYLLWHHNAVGFHITNFLFHILSCVALYGCVYEVSRWSPRVNLLRLWPVIAAGTFALYPSHPEAVSWVTGRVDAVVTTFYLASVYCFMLWRRTARRTLCIAALLLMLFSLASKEMAVTIPAVWFMFESLRPRAGGRNGAWASGLKLALIYSLPAWGLLAAYFVLRKLALGTFIGGYDDSLAIDKALLVQQWTAGLHTFFVPLNAYYAADHAWLIPAWIVVTSVIYLVSIVALLTKEHRNQLLFFLGFAVVSFAPVYKLFNGIPDLEGSRFSYLGSAPIAAFFAFGLTWFPALLVRRTATSGPDSASLTQSNRWLLGIICSAYFFLATMMLWLNNQPWTVAGRWAGKLEKSLEIILANPSPGQKFAFFNIPNNYRGAYLARNAIGDIGQHAEADWKALEPDDRHSETGQIRQSIIDGGNNYQTFYWSDDLGNFVPVRLSRNLNEPEVAAWNKLSLNKKCSIIQGSERIKNSKDDAGWTVSAGSTPILLALNYQKLQPSRIEFLQVDGSSSGSGNGSGVGSRDGSGDGSGVGVNSLSGAKPISLLVSNAFMPTQCLNATILPVSSVTASSKHQGEKLLFTLRSLAGWFSTDDKSAMVFVIPPTWAGSLDLTIRATAGILPKLQRLTKAKDVSSQSTQKLFFDVSKIQGATNALLQISKKNECFSNQCTFDFDEKHSGKLVPLSGIQSKYDLKYDDLNGDGQYQVRCWALNDAGTRVGVSSDYLFITAQKVAL